LCGDHSGWRRAYAHDPQRADARRRERSVRSATILPTGGVAPTGSLTTGEPVPPTFTWASLNATEPANAEGNNVTTYNSDGSQIAPTITVGLNGPYAVAVDTFGKIYVTSLGNQIPGNGTLTTYNPDGTQTTPTITGLTFPSGVAVDRFGKIYVAEAGEAIVRTFTREGVPTTPIISTGLNAPFDVAVDLTGKIYVADAGNHALETYTPTGVQATPTITGLEFPQGVAVDVLGRIYIANQGRTSAPGGNTVMIFTKAGALTETISAGLSSPYRVAVDLFGKFYVTNAGCTSSGVCSGNGNVTTFTSKGIQTSPTIMTGVMNPVGVAVH
jgi:hypothetical protein